MRHWLAVALILPGCGEAAPVDARPRNGPVAAVAPQANAVAQTAPLTGTPAPAPITTLPIAEGRYASEDEGCANPASSFVYDRGQAGLVTDAGEALQPLAALRTEGDWTVIDALEVRVRPLDADRIELDAQDKVVMVRCPEGPEPGFEP